jgi:hypothetical protein
MAQYALLSRVPSQMNLRFAKITENKSKDYKLFTTCPQMLASQCCQPQEAPAHAAAGDWGERTCMYHVRKNEAKGRGPCNQHAKSDRSYNSAALFGE